MILNQFPTRVGTPNQRWLDTKQEALEMINRHNGYTHIYAALYPQGIIDKIVWDFDRDDYDSWDDMMCDFRRLTRELDDEGYSQMSVFSGRGLHKYLATESFKPEQPKSVLKTVQTKYQSELDLNSDDAIFGDVKRIFRVPNTYHPIAGRYCIPLTQDEVLSYSQEDIYELAQSQRNGISPITSGDKYSIRKYDKAGNSMAPSYSGSKIDGDFNPAEVEPEGVLFPIYPCISNILQNWRDMEQKGHGMGYRRRFIVILHLKETGHTYEEAVSVLKKYMSEEEFYHCVYDEKQVRQVYMRDDLLFPSCDRLQTEIPCIHTEDNPCEKRDTIYY